MVSSRELTCTSTVTAPPPKPSAVPVRVSITLSAALIASMIALEVTVAPLSASMLSSGTVLPANWARKVSSVPQR